MKVVNTGLMQDDIPQPYHIRPERPEDFGAISALVREAFASAAHSDGEEHLLVSRLRDTDEYIPGLSLVAVRDNIVVGYVMFSEVRIGGQRAVALAPVAVSPEVQGKGIGKLLIAAGHKTAVGLGYTCSLVLGYPEYYSKFGYRPASGYGIVPPFEVPDEYFMACQLDSKSTMPQGVVAYSAAFGL